MRCMPIQVRGVMNRRGVSTWYTGSKGHLNFNVVFNKNLKLTSFDILLDHCILTLLYGPFYSDVFGFTMPNLNLK